MYSSQKSLLYTKWLCTKQTIRFTEWVESIYTSCLEMHFSTWHDPSTHLVVVGQTQAILQMYESNFPICALVLSIATNNNNNSNQSMWKKYLSLQYSVSMFRQRSANLLTTWTMLEGLPQVARGPPHVANNTSVTRGCSLCYPAIFRKLKSIVPMVCDRNRRLLQSEVYLNTAFDSFQLFLNKKL